MGGGGFHDPDLSWGVFRRRFGDELLHLFEGYLEILSTRGRSLSWNHSFPDRQKYRSAVYRLRKDGLIADRGGLDQTPSLVLTTMGEDRIRPEMKPERFWKKRWGGTWYLLMYDVPEMERSYRNALRGFLERLRMGCLQRSVWISHSDIRGEFADLRDAASVDSYAFLFEAQTLLDMRPDQIVRKAWAFDRLAEEQRWYCSYAREKNRKVIAGSFSGKELQALACEEMSAYLTAMTKDPLLPAEIHPSGYLGRTAWDVHRDLIREIAHRL